METPANAESRSSPSENSIQIREVSKRFSTEFTAVDRVSLDIRRGEFFSLLGPSGCGKTTLLRMIAGFEQPTEGRIQINGQDVTGTPPYERPVNLVFQHYALFPHLSVARNVAFGLRYLDLAKSEYPARVGKALELVRLSGLERRYPNELSGGQKQRVALARALVLRPQVLLLDEPLGALDQKLRKEMQVELKNLQRTLGITFVFVTHDQEEAMTMSDRVAVMNGGKVEQCDAASVVFEYPATEFVAGFVGAANFFNGAAGETTSDGHVCVTAAGGIETRVPTRGKSVAPGAVRFVIRPEKLVLRHNGANAGSACMPVVIEQCVYQGLSTVWTVKNTAGEQFTVYEQNTRPFVDGGKFDSGARAWICWDPAHAILI
jgi:spermidine/putrescine transport system ATP-binding protein